MIFSTSKQRQLIGFFRKTLKLDNDIYYEILSSYGVKSSKKLTYQFAQEILENLKNKAIALKLYTPKNNDYLKYNNMSARWGYATPKQLRKIDVMWGMVSRQKTKKDKEIALNHFVKRITGKEHINFLLQSDVSKVIKAIETMLKSTQIQNVN